MVRRIKQEVNRQAKLRLARGQSGSHTRTRTRWKHRFEPDKKRSEDIPRAVLHLGYWFNLPRPQNSNVLGTDDLIEYFLDHPDLPSDAVVYSMQCFLADGCEGPRAASSYACSKYQTGCVPLLRVVSGHHFKRCVFTTQSCLKESVRSVFGVHPAVTIVPRPARDDFMKSIVLTGIMSWISVWCLGCIIMKLSQTHLFPNRLWAMDNMNKFIFRTTINPLLQCFPLFSFYVYNIQKPDIGKGIICY